MAHDDMPRGRLETRLQHAGGGESVRGAVIHPVFQSANYLMGEPDSEDALRYARLNNSPSHLTLHRRLAGIEKSEAALTTASGMTAITSTLLTFLRSGDHLLAHRALYGGTHGFLTEDATALGITTTAVDMTDASGWEAALQDNTRVFYVEALSNPLMEVGDLRAVVEFSRQHDLLTIIDNTFLSPVNFQPIPFGFDIVVHSATKYLNGHSDLVAGVVAGRASSIDQVRSKQAHLGGSLDPHACFLLERGLRTLSVRVERHNTNALQLARFLESHPKVRRVQYPGLQSHAGHRRAREWFAGFGGMLSFTLQSAEMATPFLAALRIPLHAPSLGATVSLVVQPSRSSHRDLPEEERRRFGMTQDLIRVSVGIEHIDDLLADFQQALDAV
jgi:cystathionine beta-lyase/cystathionine gamma-synthase